MRRLMRTAAAALVAVLVGFAVFIAVTLPPALRHLDAPLPAGIVYGAYHVHSVRSDGSGTVDEIAAAAARAGLQFVIFTDHGDATRPPQPPAYRHGVLCLDGVEIGTGSGHLVALGLTGPAPYPLAGAAADVIEDVHRLGGWTVAAHPNSPKPALRWRAWNTPFDAIEWLNADSEWRDEPVSRLIATAARSVLRPPESVASLFARPVATLRRWDSLVRNRPVTAVLGLDAHARIGADSDGGARGPVIRWPGYEQMFRTAAQAVGTRCAAERRRADRWGASAGGARGGAHVFDHYGDGRSRRT